MLILFFINGITETEDADAVATDKESTEDKGIDQYQKTEGNEESKDDSPKKASMVPTVEFIRLI
ncbi:hypothetical protein Q0N12_11055 [Rossellomorea marisflavi]|uniref:hypothetical protein n=1 Tax=Rossellomorea marisflavi TaxID=189381 RepID=UPI003459CE8F